MKKLIKKSAQEIQDKVFEEMVVEKKLNLVFSISDLIRRINIYVKSSKDMIILKRWAIDELDKNIPLEDKTKLY